VDGRVKPGHDALGVCNTLPAYDEWEILYEDFSLSLLYPRNTPPVFFVTSATILPATASIS
jgi:hypothetical protein